MKKLFYFIVVMILLFSCKKSVKKTEFERYREINPVKELLVKLNKCDIEIVGYHKDFIEIDVKKTLYSGISSDIKLISIEFLKDNETFIINANVPARVDGNLYLKIFVPFILFKIELNSENSNVIVGKFPGNIFIKNERGEISVDFYGSILRLSTITGNININLKSSDNIDAIIQNDEGNIKVNLYQVGEVSFIDIINKKGNTNLNLFKNIEHDLIISARSKQDVLINYDLNLEYIDGIPSFIKGSTYNNSLINHTKIFVSTTYGKINISRGR